MRSRHAGATMATECTPKKIKMLANNKVMISSVQA